MAGLAQSPGAYAEGFQTTAEFAAAFGRAVASGRLALLNPATGLDQITPHVRLTDAPNGNIRR
jgi:hypothetical protein